MPHNLLETVILFSFFFLSFFFFFYTGRTFSFFEGDIVLDTDMRRRIDRQRRNRRHNRFRRAVVRPVTRLWKYGEVPYLIDQRIGMCIVMNLSTFFFL